MTETTTAPRTRRRRTVLIVVLSILGLVLIAVGWVGVRAMMAKGELDAMVSLVGDVKSAADARDLDRLGGLSDDFVKHADRAASLTSDPVWRLAEVVPWIGPDLAAVRITSQQLDAVGTHAVRPLVDLAAGMQKDAVGGGLDVAGLAKAAKPLANASATVRTATRTLDAVDTSALIPQLARGVEQLRSTLATVDETLGPLAQGVTVLPALLGADGPRTLLLVVQNNAELRTGGGITGTFLELRAANGKVTLQRLADSSQFAYRSTPIIPVPEDLTTLYGDVTGRFVQDASIPADFSLTGELVSAWWKDRTGDAPDAVVSIDPIVLQSLLKATGPVPLPDGTALTADDLVQRLLVDPYMTMSSAQQTVFFAQATASIFTRLFGQGLDPIAWVQALAQPVQDGRVSVWSSVPDEQKALSASALGGPAVRQRLAGDDAYAVYLNDNDGGKMATYLTTKITSGTATCRADGRKTVVVDVAVTSTAPANAASLPISMTGGGLWGVGAGDIGLIISVSAPRGAFYGGVSLDGKLLPSANATDAGFPVSAAHVNLQPGETNVVQFRFIVDGAGHPVILHTPLVTAPEVSASKPACD
jgi:hypothetical protein